MFQIIVCVVGIAFGTAAAAAAQDAAGSNARGEQVYVDQKCAICHSVAKKGNVKGPLDEVGTKLTTAEIHDWLVDAKGMTVKTKAARKPAMRSYVLPKDDLDALVAYLSSLKKK